MGASTVGGAEGEQVTLLSSEDKALPDLAYHWASLRDLGEILPTLQLWEVQWKRAGLSREAQLCQKMSFSMKGVQTCLERFRVQSKSTGGPLGRHSSLSAALHWSLP